MYTDCEPASMQGAVQPFNIEYSQTYFLPKIAIFPVHLEAKGPWNYALIRRKGNTVVGTVTITRSAEAARYRVSTSPLKAV